MGEMVEFPGVERRRIRKPLWRNVLGEVLRGERLEQERILTEVAQSAGVSPQYLSEVERGRKEASSEVLGAVADALGLELAEVVGRVADRLTPAASRRPEPARTLRSIPAAPAAPFTGNGPAGPPHGLGSSADVLALAA